LTELSPPVEAAMTLLSAPIELAGDWGHMLPYAADQVVAHMRQACLDGVRLISDRQPTRLRVDEHTSGPPAIWLHPDGSSMAWIIVDIGERAWAQVAYQFGHELGHVLANSWQPHAKPALQCQWLEEALVEAFSLRGLGQLADRWAQDPPFVQDNAFGTAIAGYRLNILQTYAELATGGSRRMVRGAPRPDRGGRRAQSVRASRRADDSRRVRACARLPGGSRRAEPLAGTEWGADRRLPQSVGSKLCRTGGIAAFADTVAGSSSGLKQNISKPMEVWPREGRDPDQAHTDFRPAPARQPIMLVSTDLYSVPNRRPGWNWISPSTGHDGIS
jgi:hypothetical protein